jgi:DNA-binding transcriptional ArsR family regulator
MTVSKEERAAGETISREAARHARLLKALSHEDRLLIMALVRDTERSVGELERLLGQPQPAVSQHLARLRQDDFVKIRRDGRTIYYSANRDVLNESFTGLLQLLTGDRSRQLPTAPVHLEQAAAAPAL